MPIKLSRFFRARVAVLSIIVIAYASFAQARLGETTIQLADRNGAPKDTSATKVMDSQFPLLEGALHHTYEYQGWKIRAAFLRADGPAVRVDYQKVITNGVNPKIQDYELQAIMTAETAPGTSWKQVTVNNPDSPNKGLAKFAEAYFAGAMGEKMWQRSDGATLLLKPGGLILSLELPAARQYLEQRKTEKEQKARASVPKF